MASLVLGAIGAGIGYAVGPLTFMGMSSVSLGWSIGSTLGSLVEGGNQKPQTTYGPRLGDLKVQASTYGQPIPRIYGSFRAAGNMIWSMPIKETVHKTKVKSGGKGGGKKKATQISYTYSQTFAIAICEGPIVGVRKIWANGDLIYNVGDDASAGTLVASNQAAASIQFYTGSETQIPNSIMQANVGVVNCPAYRGVAYVVFSDLQLEKYGNRAPNIEFEVLEASSVIQSRIMALGDSLGEAPNIPDVGLNGVAMRHASLYSSGAGLLEKTYDISYQCNQTLIGQTQIDGYTSAVAISNLPSAYVLRTSGARYSIYYGGTIRGDYSTGMALPSFATYAYGFIYQSVLTNNFRATLDGLGLVNLGGVQYRWMFTDAAGNLYGQLASPHHVYRLDADLNQVEGPWTISGATGIPYAFAKDDDSWFIYDSSGSAKVCRLEDDGGYAFNLNAAVASHTVAYLIVPPAYMSSGLVLGLVSPYKWQLVNLLPGLSGSGRAIRDIVEAECAKVGLSGAKIDASALTDTVTGYAISNRGTVRAGLEPLASGFYFDGIELDGALKFIKRGGSLAATIAEDDLAAHEWGTDQPDTALLERTQDVELPDEVTLNYMDKDAGYVVGTQYSRRLIGSSRTQQLVSVAMALSAAKAKNIADVLMYNAWQGRVSFLFSTSVKYSHLVPGDVVAIIKGGVAYTARLVSRDEQGGVIRFGAVLEDLQIYDQDAPAPSIPVPSEDVKLDGPTKLYLLDIPLLRDADDGYGIYAAAHGYLSGWDGAQIFKSTDGASWAEYGDVHLFGATAGFATTVLGAFGQNAFDESNSVTVTLTHGELFSAPEADVLNGDNAALLGDEIIQFRTATLVSGTTWTLTGLLRGRKGTEWAVGSHTIGERFILLEAETVLPQPLAIGDLGLDRIYRGVTFGTLVADAESVPFTFSGVPLKPYAPVHLGGGRDAAGNLTINWIRRSRVGGEWTDYADVPIGEDSQSYEVEIWDSGYTALKRTITGLTSATAAYTAAEQTTDFGSTQSTVYCRIYQLSALVGRGYKLEGTV